MCRGLGKACSCIRRKKSLWCFATLTLAVICVAFYFVETFREPAIACAIGFSFLSSVGILCCCMMKTNNRSQDVECNNGSSEYDDMPLKPPSYDTVILEDKMNRAHGGSPAVHLLVPKTVPLTCQGENDNVTTSKKSTDADLPLLSTSNNTGRIIWRNSSFPVRIPILPELFISKAESWSFCNSHLFFLLISLTCEKSFNFSLSNFYNHELSLNTVQLSCCGFIYELYTCLLYTAGLNRLCLYDFLIWCIHFTVRFGWSFWTEVAR